MSTSRSPKKTDGKPSVPRENAAPQERTKAGDDRGKPSLEPGSHDANVDRHGALDDDHEVE